MVVQRKLSHIIFDTFNVIFLIFLCFLTLYPFLFVIFSSFSNADKLMIYQGFLYKPVGFSVAAYKAVLQNASIYMGYKNTLIIVFVGTFINIVMTSIGAYVLSRKDFMWVKFMNIMVVISMFFNGGLIPTYLVVKGLGLYNSLFALMIPVAINTWNLLIMRTAFANIPDSLIESARIDGATEITVLIKIVLPLSLATIAVMVLYYGVAHWNSWFGAAIYLSDKDKYPLQLLLREILIQMRADSMLSGVSASDKESVSETIIYATIIVSTLPILCVYPFIQKYFAKGVMIGAVKG